MTKFFTDYASLSFESRTFQALEGVIDLPDDPAWLAHLRECRLIADIPEPTPQAEEKPGKGKK
jgi:hypothetical protein